MVENSTVALGRVKARAVTLTLVSYCPKKNRNVILLSTEHHDKAVDAQDHHKPDIIMHYNRTKFGVDTVDQMARTYSIKVASRRWPFVFFCNMLDVGALNVRKPGRDIGKKFSPVSRGPT